MNKLKQIAERLRNDEGEMGNLEMPVEPGITELPIVAAEREQDLVEYAKRALNLETQPVKLTFTYDGGLLRTLNLTSIQFDQFIAVVNKWVDCILAAPDPDEEFDRVEYDAAGQLKIRLDALLLLDSIAGELVCTVRNAFILAELCSSAAMDNWDDTVDLVNPFLTDQLKSIRFDPNGPETLH